MRKHPAYAPPLTDPDFGPLQFVHDSDDPGASFWRADWTFPATGTVIGIVLPGGKDGPRVVAREFYLGLPDRFEQILTSIRPQLKELFGSEMGQELPQDILSAVKPMSIDLEISRGQTLLWDLTFETLDGRRSTISVSFIGDAPQDAGISIAPEPAPVVLARDLREEFRPIVARFRPRRLTYLVCTLIAVPTGLVGLASAGILPWALIILLFFPLTLVLVMLGPRLRCPACSGDVSATDIHCPECGASPLKEEWSRGGVGGTRRVHDCDGCGKRIRHGARHNFRTHYCTHCGAFLDDVGVSSRS